MLLMICFGVVLLCYIIQVVHCACAFCVSVISWFAVASDIGELKLLV